MGRLDQVPVSDQEGLIDAFMASAAFPGHMHGLMRALERMPSRTPSNAIDVCERVVGLAGADLADLAKSSALTGRDLSAVVLRVQPSWRPGHARTVPGHHRQARRVRPARPRGSTPRRAMTLSTRSPWDSEEVAATASTAALLTGSVPRQDRATTGQLDEPGVSCVSASSRLTP